MDKKSKLAKISAVRWLDSNRPLGSMLSVSAVRCPTR